MKLKYWIGFGDNPIFSKRDLPIFIVAPRDGNKEQYLHLTCYVEADDVSQARELLKKAIDDHFDHLDHIAHLENKSEEKKSKPKYTDDPTTSLTIGGPSEKDSLPFIPPSDDLLDLGGLADFGKK